MRRLALLEVISIAALSLPAQAASDLARAEWSATGGHSWDAVAGISLQGTMIEGGVPGRFEKIIDLRTGHSRTRQDTGVMRSWRGYDGMAWNAFNGIVNNVDLPPLLDDARAQAFVDRAGWRDETAETIVKTEGDLTTVRYTPTRSSAVEVSFDPKSHLVTQIVIEGDEGPLTTTYSDWRPVGNVKYPFRQVQTTITGEVIALEVDRLRLLRRLSGDALSRPKSSSHGRLLAKNASVPFRNAGAHILVSAKINDVDAELIFDTGAANYYSPESARRFGLKVSGGLNLSGPGESSTTGGFAKAKKVTLGDAELRDQIVIVGPTPWPRPPGKKVADGSAGFEFLYEFRTTIDYPAQTIRFAELNEPPSMEGTRVPFYSDGHSIYIEAEVDGQRGLFRLDTGDGNTVTLFPTFAKLHDLYQNAGESAVSGGGVGGVVSARRITMSRFTLAGADFRDFPGRVSQNIAGSFSSRSLAGNLGGGLLRCFRITFDYRARVLTLQSDPDARCAARVVSSQG